MRFVLALCVLLATSPAAPAEIEAGSIHFAAVLSADEESAPTYSSGAGRADFVLDRATLMFRWTVTYRDLTSPITGVHIHGPQRPGTNAGILVDIGDNGLQSPIRGSVALNEGQLEYLLAGRLYVNIHSTKYRDGELRGQIQRLRQPPAD